MADGDMQTPAGAIRLFDHENCKRGTLCCTVNAAVFELHLPWLPTIFRLVGTVLIIIIIIIIIVIFFSFSFFFFFL